MCTGALRVFDEIFYVVNPQMKYYNGGSDTFELYLLGKDDAIVNSQNDVYVDQLIGVIDGMLEKNGSETEILPSSKPVADRKSVVKGLEL